MGVGTEVFGTLPPVQSTEGLTMPPSRKPIRIIDEALPATQCASEHSIPGAGVAHRLFDGVLLSRLLAAAWLAKNDCLAPVTVKK